MSDLQAPRTSAEAQQLARELNGVSPAAMAAHGGELTGPNVHRVDGDYAPFVLKLRQPIQVGGRVFAELTFREVGMSDLIIIEDEGEKWDTMKKVWARMAGGVPVELFDQLPVKEVTLIRDFFMDCMGGLLDKV